MIDSIALYPHRSHNLTKFALMTVEQKPQLAESYCCVLFTMWQI